MPRPLPLRLVLAGLSLWLSGTGAGDAAVCSDLLPAASADAPQRTMTVADLARLRDIGSIDMGLGAASPLALSPDGHSVAFLLSRADPAANRYCRAIVVLPVNGAGPPRIVAGGGDFFSMKIPSRDLVTENGVAAVVSPRWSPDGRSIAYLRRDRDGPPQLWIAAADGGRSRPVTHGPVEIDGFAWSADGRALIVRRQTGRKAAQADQQREGLAGYRYDRRFVPIFGPGPRIAWDLAPDYQRVDLARDGAAAAPPDEIARIEPAQDWGKGVVALAESHGRRAALVDGMPGRLFGPVYLTADDRLGRSRRCTAPACVGERFLGLWWTADGQAVLYLRREGWGSGQFALYRWAPGAGRPRQVLRTPDILTGCQIGPAGLLCLREGSLQPRRIVLIDPRTGRQHVLFDPNPEMRQWALGTVRRLFWRNAFGFAAFGDLVLPPGFRAGDAKLPMVVVQYESRGFLRGGTGDEYPILPLAAQGFAVLSVQVPRQYSTRFPAGTWRDWNDAERGNVEDWNERRSVAGSLLRGIAAAEALNVVDPGRIGITGLSDGATTAWYLMINDHRFAAASVSTCCADPKTDAILVGPAWEAVREQTGYPSPIVDAAGFWQPVSPALNAATMRTPVLLQLADSEYIRALEAYAALRRVGPPTEMFVFPGEYHIKWQPAHRLAVYERNIDWFNYWLRGVRSPASDKQEQYRRWSSLRDQAVARGWRPRDAHRSTQSSASSKRIAS